jgi:hypothetical protein
MALALPEVEEREHMSHPDFRVGGRIFATLGYPDATRAMVKLFPDQQAAFVADDPKAFTPVKGAWGRKGCTSVLLKAAGKTRVREALHAAWRNASVRTALRTLEAEEPALKRKSSATRRTALQRSRRVSKSV